MNSQLNLSLCSDFDSAKEEFEIEGGEIFRTVTWKSGAHSTGFELPVPSPAQSIDDHDLASLFDQLWLQSVAAKHLPEHPSKIMRGVDLFCGCGGFTLGFQSAAHAMGMALGIEFASDIDTLAAQVYKENFKPKLLSTRSIQDELSADLDEAVTKSEADLVKNIGNVDFLVGGPPCQGHSDLNNHTRREDPKNQLYSYMARATKLLKPQLVVIENVPGARHDRTSAVADTFDQLLKLGYSVDATVVDAKDFGAAQSRRRYIMVACRSGKVSLLSDLAPYNRPPRNVSWAIGDLINYKGSSVFDSSAQHSEENKRRINYLFDNDLYDLPNEQRPPCHRDKSHSYNSVYGRMYWDRPAQTITTGFGSTGQGRFVHPKRRRTLSPHEAARIQFFPDFFEFGEIGRVKLQKLIGNAVPSKLGHVLGLAYFPRIRN